MDPVKDKIRKCALNHFNQDGVHFHLDTLSKELKISKKTLYKHYENKEAILSDIVDELFRAIKEKEHEIYTDQSLTPLEQLIEILCVYPDYEAVNYHHILSIKETYPQLYQRVDQYLENNWDETFELLNLNIKLGLIRPIGNETFKTLLLGLYKQLLLTEHDSPQMLMRECIHHIFYGLINNNSEVQV